MSTSSSSFGQTATDADTMVASVPAIFAANFTTTITTTITTNATTTSTTSTSSYGSATDESTTTFPESAHAIPVKQQNLKRTSLQLLPYEMKQQILFAVAEVSPTLEDCISLSKTCSSFQQIYQRNKLDLLEHHVRSVLSGDLWVSSRLMVLISDTVKDWNARYSYPEPLFTEEDREDLALRIEQIFLGDERALKCSRQSESRGWLRSGFSLYELEEMYTKNLQVTEILRYIDTKAPLISREKCGWDQLSHTEKLTSLYGHFLKVASSTVGLDAYVYILFSATRVSSTIEVATHIFSKDLLIASLLAKGTNTLSAIQKLSSMRSAQTPRVDIPFNVIAEQFVENASLEKNALVLSANERTFGVGEMEEFKWMMFIGEMTVFLVEDLPERVFDHYTVFDLDLETPDFGVEGLDDYKGESDYWDEEMELEEGYDGDVENGRSIWRDPKFDSFINVDTLLQPETVALASTEAMR